MLGFGDPRTLTFAGGRYQLTDSLVWQKRNHRLRLGFDWEHSTTSGSQIPNNQAQITLFSPQQARNARIPVPASFTTLDDILQLPLRSFQTGVGPGTVLHWYRLQPVGQRAGTRDSEMRGRAAGESVRGLLERPDSVQQHVWTIAI